MDHTTALASLLSQHGFHRHKLVRNQVGHFQLVGSLHDAPVDILLDTGAASTVVDLSYCRAKHIPTRDTGKLGGGAGGITLAIHALDGVILSLDGHPLRIRQRQPFSPSTTDPTHRLLINNTDPNQPGYIVTIGNRLDDAGISWRWYSGGWNVALQNNTHAAQDPNIIFQFHHQPFAYYTKYAPFLEAPNQNYTTSPPLNPNTTGPNAHLQDETQFLDDLRHNRLPAVSFIKFAGIDNEHPGYTNVVRGQQHVADIVAAVQNSNIWDKCAIIVTYDENGGRWDHVVPPVRADGWGTGVRVPAIIISPLVRTGYVDHTQYETVSILKLLEFRFNLAPLAARDADSAVNDLVDAFTEHE
jgi:acid phosphatase